MKVLRISMTYPRSIFPGIGLPTYYESFFSKNEEVILTAKIEGAIKENRKGVVVTEINQKISSLGTYEDSKLKRLFFLFRKIREQILFLWKSKKYIKEFHPDIIHVSSPIPILCGIYGKKICDSKIVMSLHGSDVLRISKVRIFGRILRIPDAIVVVSENMKNMIPSNILRTPLVYVGNGVDLNSFKNLGRNRKKQFIHIANLRWQKGQMYLLNGFHKFYQSHRDYTLKIIGDGEERKDLEEKCIFYGINEAVEFCGTRDREYIVEALNESYAFVLTSVSEGFPKVIIEAMATGTPVLSSDVGNIANVVKDAGIIFEPQNADAICNAMNRIVDEANWLNYSKRCEEYAKEYSWEKHSDRLNAVYCEVLRNKNV